MWWKDQIPDKHFWVYCKRQGDTVVVLDNPDKTKDLIIVVKNN